MILEKLQTKYGEKSIFMASSDSTGCMQQRIKYPYMFLKDTFTTINMSQGFPGVDHNTARELLIELQKDENPSDETKKRITNCQHSIQTYECDVLWLQRANHELIVNLIHERKKLGKSTIYDLDDWMWDIPAGNLAHRHYPKKELQKLDNVIKLCDCITTSTVPLKEGLENRYPDKKVFLLPNHLWKNELFIEGDKPKNEKVKIAFSGSYTHSPDFDHYLINVLRGLPKDKCDFYCMGFTPAFMKDFAISLPWVETNKFHQAFKDQNFDIGIMVASDNMFNRCKSNLKYLEGSATQTAMVGHSVYPYSTLIEHGVDGYLVNKPKTEWKEFIYTLIEDEPFRLQMAKSGHEKVNRNFTYDENWESLEETYIDIFDHLEK